MIVESPKRQIVLVRLWYFAGMNSLQYDRPTHTLPPQQRPMPKNQMIVKQILFDIDAIKQKIKANTKLPIYGFLLPQLESEYLGTKNDEIPNPIKQKVPVRPNIPGFTHVRSSTFGSTQFTYVFGELQSIFQFWGLLSHMKSFVHQLHFCVCKSQHKYPLP